MITSDTMKTLGVLNGERLELILLIPKVIFA
jgi:hypothetical protein